jgi:hypothetical protein
VLRGILGEEPGKQTEGSCRAWEFSRRQAQKTSGTKGRACKSSRQGMWASMAACGRTGGSLRAAVGDLRSDEFRQAGVANK